MLLQIELKVKLTILAVLEVKLCPDSGGKAPSIRKKKIKIKQTVFSDSELDLCIQPILSARGKAGLHYIPTHKPRQKV